MTSCPSTSSSPAALQAPRPFSKESCSSRRRLGEAQASAVPDSTMSQVQPAPAKPEPIRAKEFASKITAKFPDTKVDWMRERRLKITAALANMKELCTFV